LEDWLGAKFTDERADDCANDEADNAWCEWMAGKRGTNRAANSQTKQRARAKPFALCEHALPSSALGGVSHLHSARWLKQGACSRVSLIFAEHEILHNLFFGPMMELSCGVPVRLE
jgi:hypothetical protein